MISKNRNKIEKKKLFILKSVLCRGTMEPMNGFEDIYLGGRMSLKECYDACKDNSRSRNNRMICLGKILDSKLSFY